MASPAEKISESEFEVMRVLWQAGRPLSVPELRQKLESRWDSSTIKTLLRRLCGKGVLRADRHKLTYYTPLVSEAEYESYATRELLDRVYHGSAKNLIASLVTQVSLSDEELAELRAILESGGER